MATKKNADSRDEKAPVRPVGRPPIEHPKVGVSAKIDPDLYDFLDQYAKSLKPRTTVSAVIELAIEEFRQRMPVPPKAANGGKKAKADED